MFRVELFRNNESRYSEDFKETYKACLAFSAKDSYAKSAIRKMKKEEDGRKIIFKILLTDTTNGAIILSQERNINTEEEEE